MSVFGITPSVGRMTTSTKRRNLGGKSLIRTAKIQRTERRLALMEICHGRVIMSSLNGCNYAVIVNMQSLNARNDVDGLIVDCVTLIKWR